MKIVIHPDFYAKLPILSSSYLNISHKKESCCMKVETKSDVIG